MVSGEAAPRGMKVRGPDLPSPKKQGESFYIPPAHYILALMSIEFSGIDTVNFGDLVEVDVGGNDFLDPVINHRGGVDGVAGGDRWNFLHQGKSPVGFRDGYRVHRDANTDHGGVDDFRKFRFSDGKIAAKNFLQNFRIGDGKNVP
jgi:hypothetical protein